MVAPLCRCVAAALALACLALLAGCGGGDDAGVEQGGPRVFVAAVENSDFFVGITRFDGEVLAYACDGAANDAWFAGQETDGSLDLTSRDGEASLRAELDEDEASGTLEIGGQTLDFTAESAVGGQAGLYRAEGEAAGEETLTGWIVLPDGRQKGVRRVGRRKARAPQLFVFRRVISPSV